jgi:hypothetical protein
MLACKGGQGHPSAIKLRKYQIRKFADLSPYNFTIFLPFRSMVKNVRICDKQTGALAHLRNLRINAKICGFAICRFKKNADLRFADWHT